MSLQARAEQGLLEALQKPRKSAATVKVIGRGEIEVPDKEVLRKWRRNHERQQALRAQEEDLDVVASLGHQPIDPALRNKEFPKLAQKRIDKRNTHDLTVKKFESTLVEISDALELKVIEACRTVQQGIGACDQTIADIFAELNQDLWLVTKDHQFVLDQWTKIESECLNRKDQIAKYEKELEEIEGSRANRVAGELRVLVETLTQTAFKSPTYIERLVEAEAFELNTVLIVNRQSHAELLSLMEKKHIIVALEARTNWEVRQAAWRRLRHNRCVDEFHNDLASKAFTNPPKRISVFEKMKEAQAIRHKTRLEKLGELMKLQLPSSDVVQLVKASFDTLNAAEDEAIGELYEQLEEIRSERQSAAEARREALRAELHQYGALEDEPDLEAHAAAIENLLVGQPELEAFFRSAGGLKPELKELMTELRDWALIYDQNLQPTIKRVQVLICGLEVPQVLESQGKSGMRSNLIDSLERLKNATKLDVPSMLPVLLSQVSELISVTALDPLLLDNLNEVHEDLLTIITDADIRMGGGSSAMSKSMLGSSMGGMAATTGGVGTDYARSVKSKATSQVRSKASSSGKRSMGGGGAGGSRSRHSQILEAPEVNMLEVRAVQKRLMMLLRTSDLDEGFQNELRTILQSLRQKARCNAAIDEVVTVESVGPLAARDEEYVTITDQAIRFLERNTSHVHEISVRLSAFFKALAVILEEHAVKDEDIDIQADESLLELAEDFKEEDEEREKQVSIFSEKLKHAADERELEEAYASVLAMLDKIDASYYQYHASATQKAGLHPVRINEEAISYMAKLCKALGLKYRSEGLENGNNATLYADQGMTLDNDAMDGAVTVMSSTGASQAQFKGSGDDSGDNGEMNMGGEGGFGGTMEWNEARDEYYTVPGSEVAYLVDQSPSSIVNVMVMPPPEEEEESVASAEDGSVMPESVGGYENETVDELESAVQALELPSLSEGEGLLKKSQEGEDGENGGDINLVKDNTAAVKDLKAVAGGGILDARDDENKEGEEGGEEEDDEAQSLSSQASAKKWRAPWFVEGYPPKPSHMIEEAGKVKGDTAVVDEENEDSLEQDMTTNANQQEKLLAEKEAAFIELDNNVLQSLTQVQKEEYFKVYKEVKAYRELVDLRNKKAKEEARIALYAAPPPLDPDGTPVAMSVMLPQDSMVEMISNLRESLIRHSENYSNKRKEFGDALCHERQTDFTEELEERLRLHWPRKGRVEVKIRQVREGQLIAHRQRAQRHGRVVREKCAKQHAEFEVKVSKAAARYKYFSDQIKALERTLPAQESLAALQGLEGKCKKLVQGFREECEETLQDLSLSTTSEPAKLFLLSDTLLKSTNLFGFDGDYSEFEYQELQAQIAQLNGEIEHSVRLRLLQLEGLIPRQEAAFAGEVQFMRRFELALQELSLREAIGMKYGAPRRNAQERLRTEQTCDANSADAVDVLLDQLETLCQDCKYYVDVDKGLVARKEGEIVVESSLPKSAIIRENLKTLRALLFRRASYLEFLPNPKSIDVDRDVMVEALSKKDDAALKRSVPQFVPTLAETMQFALNMMEEKCRSETRELYEEEGKADTLGPAGVPDALQEWLTKCRVTNLGEEGHRDKSRRRLRQQIERMELLLAKEPVPPNPNILGAGAAMVEESCVRSLRSSNKFTSQVEKSFQSRLDVWNAAKLKHHSLLRPQMGRPDAKGELDALDQKEHERIEEAIQAIDDVRLELVAGQIDHAKNFVLTISEQTTAALALIDTMVVTDDLGYLPGDELIEKKRKSLKRLRKLQRTKAEAGELEGDDGEAAVGADNTGAAEEAAEGGVTTSPTNKMDGYEKPDGRHLSTRNWPALPVQQLKQLFERHQITKCVEDTSWIDELSNSFGSEAGGPVSAVTTAHRQVIRSRDANWDRFISDLDEKFSRLEEHLGQLQQGEETWRSTWEGHVQGLIKDNQFM